MPFYLVEQRGVPGARFVEAEKPASALKHVIGDSFTITALNGRDLVDAARQYECETAGAPRIEEDGDDEPGVERVRNDVDPDDHRVITEPDPDALRDLRDDPARDSVIEDFLPTD